MEKSKRDGNEAFGLPPENEFVQNDKLETILKSAGQNSNFVPSRSAVLRACTITSGLIAALGIVIRQVLFLLCIARLVFSLVPIYMTLSP